MTNQNDELSARINALTMPELLEFARMLESESEQTMDIVCASHITHARIEFLSLVKKVRRSAATYAQPQKRRQNEALLKVI